MKTCWEVSLADRREAVSPPGYQGRYLRVDLTGQTAEAVSIPSEVLRAYIGGSGLGTWLLLRETPGCVPLEARGSVEHMAVPDALAPEMPLVVSFSPLVGTPLTTSAKFAVLARSPLTERINDSLSSSHFAIAGKKTAYDAIVVRGAADAPICLVIEPHRVRVVDARAAWGMSARETEKQLQQQLGLGFRTAAIGPAGENLVHYATISHDGRHAGRGGLGAVLGSKQLKAIAVRGDRVCPTADPDALVNYARELSELSFGPATAKYRELGTVSNLLTFNRLGALPTRNFQQGSFGDAAALAPETISSQFPRTRTSCAACSIGCEHIFHVGGDDRSGVRMEYENLFALGPLCGVSDPAAVLEASRLCDECGLDTISAGGCIAFAMECAERGLIDAP
ncbi:MAG: hypothetical protein KDA75_14180, partial [Planctomycetaceae bacterium]|nr:hypothetical protein [Planctomycetaceae bacterium]